MTVLHTLPRSARLYLRYTAISLRSQMQYRASFIMQSLGMFLVTVVEIIGIWALFHRFGSLRGWRLGEVGFFYGLVNTAFALAEGIGRGFDTFDAMVRTGEFDRLLLRPRGTAFQVAARELHLARIGRLAQGVIVLGWAATTLGVHASLPHVGLILFAILGGACLFVGLFVVQATLAFWTIESLEVLNTVTYGGTETGQYPLDIYRPWFRKFFTFIVPLAGVTYFPVLAVLGRADTLFGTPRWFQALAPLSGVIFLLAALQVWRLGVRRYRSTGS